MLCNCCIVSPWPSVWRAVSTSRWHQIRQGCVSSTWCPQPAVLQALFNVHIVRARTLKVLGIVRENATQLGSIPNYFRAQKCIWSMKSNDAFSAAYFVRNVKSFLEFLRRPCGTADFVIALSSPPCSFLEKSLLLLWGSVSYWPVISTQTAAEFFVHQTPVVVHADLMSFVLTVAVKGHQEDHRIAFNQCANWSAIVIYRKHHKE